MREPIRQAAIAKFTAALELPPGTILNQRVPKKLLIENGAPTPGDKKLLHEHVDQLTWLAALKPANAGVAVFRDEAHDYLEIAVVQATLRNIAGSRTKIARIAELVHRAIPYPVLLIIDDGDDRLMTSMVHLRHAQDVADKYVLEGEHLVADLPIDRIGAEALDVSGHKAALAAMRLSHQPRTDLRSLYQGWMDTLAAWQAAAITGVFLDPQSHPGTVERRAAIVRLADTEAQIAALRRVAAKEKQIGRQVAINQDIKRLEAEQESARRILSGFP